MCRVHSLLTFLHVCVEEQIFPSICLSCENHLALCDLPCILNVLVASLVCRRSPWLTARSPWCPGWCPNGWGSLPAHQVLPLPGEGHCLPIGACLPTAGWGSLLVGYCLPIVCHKGYIACPPYPFTRSQGSMPDTQIFLLFLSFCHRSCMSLYYLLWLGIAYTQVSLSSSDKVLYCKTVQIVH